MILLGIRVWSGNWSNLGLFSKLFSMYLGTQIEFFIKIFFKQQVFYMIRMLVKFLIHFTRGVSSNIELKKKCFFFQYSIHVGTPTLNENPKESPPT